MGKKETKYPVAGVADLRDILDIQMYKCALTGDKLTPDNTCFDHIKPISKGGSSLKKNLQAVTKKANLSKSNMTMKEYLHLCFKVIENNGEKYGFKVKKLK